MSQDIHSGSSGWFYLMIAVTLSFCHSYCKALMSDILTLLWRRSLPYRNQSIDLHCKSMNWFLYDRNLRHETVKKRGTFSIKEHLTNLLLLPVKSSIWSFLVSPKFKKNKSRNMWQKFPQMYALKLMCLDIKTQEAWRFFHL